MPNLGRKYSQKKEALSCARGLQRTQALMAPTATSRFFCGRSEICTMLLSEWSLDGLALASDGQHWRSVYGGSRVVLGTIRCHAAAYVALRLVLCALMCFLLGVEMTLHPPYDSDWLLSFGHWALIVQAAYFALALGLTVVAVYTQPPGIARTTPTLVRVVELLYGVALPASCVSFLIALLVTWSQASHCISRIDSATAAPEMEVLLTGTALALVSIDMCFTRQPYYASFHAITAAAFCWGYLVFSAVWEILGGQNRHGQTCEHTFCARNMRSTCLAWCRETEAAG